MTSPTLASGTDRVHEAISGRPGDLIVNLQGDEPFIDPQQISQIAGCFLSEEVVICTLIKKITQPDNLINPNVIKVVFDRNGFKYTGRIKLVADEARTGGLKF